MAWDARSSGGGALLMPSLWHEGSYVELERCLMLMRDGGPDTLLDPATGRATFGHFGWPVTILRPPLRRQWWHLSARYRWGTTRTITVPLRRTRLGPEMILPKRCELIAGGAVIGTKQARARVYEWSVDVDEQEAARGVGTLVSLMFGGRSSQIQLPVSLLERELGQPVEAPEDVEAVPV